jgi:hypothetical protein
MLSLLKLLNRLLNDDLIDATSVSWSGQDHVAT